MFFYKFISYVASYVGPIQTEFLSGLKKLWQNRNRDSCEKIATGMENIGIRRIPAGIGNLALIAPSPLVMPLSSLSSSWLRRRLSSRRCHISAI
jgi:hypothetical protein